MANGDTGEKTEEATPKKLRDARKKGQVAKSQDMNTAILLIAVFGVLFATMSSMCEYMQYLMRTCFVYAPVLDFNPAIVERISYEALCTGAKVMAPILGVVFVTAALIAYFQVGPLFTGEPVKPQLNRLNPITGFKNKFFKMKTYVELVKSTLKLLIVGLLVYIVLKLSLRDVLLTVSMPIGGIIDIVGRLILKLVILVSIGFVAIAIADFFYQRWQYKKELRMTKYEVKREYKQEEGDPQHKAARKRLHQEIAMHDMVQAVKDADVVIVNPTHIAAAIKYNPDEMTAPQLVAKGQRLIAEQIVEIAKQYKVPIMRNLPLAQSLMELEIGEEIPEELYEAVAEVLNFVYKLAEQQEEG